MLITKPGDDRCALMIYLYGASPLSFACLIIGRITFVHRSVRTVQPPHSKTKRRRKKCERFSRQEKQACWLIFGLKDVKNFNVYL